MIKFTYLLLHNDYPIAICLVSPAALNSAARNKVFGKSRFNAKQVNRWFTNISRIVIDPRYRGAGIAGDFLRAVCRQLDYPYIEMVTAMGKATKFWEKAGFIDCGKSGGVNSYTTNKGSTGVRGRRFTQPGSVTSQSKLSQMRYYLYIKDQQELEGHK